MNSGSDVWAPRGVETIMTSTSEYQVTLRVVLLTPPRDLLYCLEDDQGYFVSTTKSTGDDIRFDFSAFVKPNRRPKKPNFTGPFCRGTPAKRFFYINIGQSAGQEDSPWQRRAKVWLSGWPKYVQPRPEEITWQMVQEVASDHSKVLVTKYQGQANDGSPSLHGASGWKVGLK